MMPRVVLMLLVTLALCTDGVAREPLRGSCYCRASGELHCTADLTEPDCQKHCNEAFCDEWFWKERLPCWNWGYGG